jgi:hypothetical protein
MLRRDVAPKPRWTRPAKGGETAVVAESEDEYFNLQHPQLLQRQGIQKGRSVKPKKGDCSSAPTRGPKPKGIVMKFPYSSYEKPPGILNIGPGCLTVTRVLLNLSCLLSLLFAGGLVTTGV